MSEAATKPRVLIVDDDPDLAALASIHVRRWGYAAHCVASAKALWRFLDGDRPEVVLLDVQLGDADGSELVAEIKQRLPEVPVIMITGSTSVEPAVRSMKRGAADYITKPLDFGRLRRAVDAALDLGRVSRRAGQFDLPRERSEFLGIVGASEPMLRLFQNIENMAPTDVSALILGETGTGKELVARAIHRASRRRDGPFIAVNAAAIPHDLIESSLFGHEKGAFTGARDTHVGYCEQAHGGTLFLDEIAEMGYELQAKLLRFLQDHEVQRVGARKARSVDVRVLAATNVDPRTEISRRRLREDLYYRLRVVSLRLPPLRQRGRDLARLARFFLERSARRHGREFRAISSQAMALLAAYPWPGNVRELENIVEEAVVLHRGSELTAPMLPPEVTRFEGSQDPEPGTSAAADEKRRSPRQERERRNLLEALEDAQGDLEKAARSLGISRATIYRHLKKYDLPR